jgi:hypothetical protein
MNQFFKTLQTAFTVSNDALVHTKTQKIIVDKELLDKEAISVSQITHFLYQYYYNETDAAYTASNLQTDSNFEEELAQLFPNKRQISEQWKVVSVDENPAYLYVKRGGITLLVDKHKHLPIVAHRNAQKEELVTITFPCQYPNISNGFFVFQSEYERDAAHTNTVLIYFNLKPSKAVIFSQLLLEKLYANNIAFEYKVFKYIKTTQRMDTGVLYFNTDEYDHIIQLLYPLFKASSECFNTANSIFHYKLFPGIGLAEEPLFENSIKRESYGTHRCRLLAEAIYKNLNVLKIKNKLPAHIFSHSLKNNGINPMHIFFNGDDSALYKYVIKYSG